MEIVRDRAIANVKPLFSVSDSRGDLIVVGVGDLKQENLVLNLFLFQSESWLFFERELQARTGAWLDKPDRRSRKTSPLAHTQKDFSLLSSHSPSLIRTG